MQAESEAKRLIKEVINTISAEANRPVNLIRRRRQSNHLAATACHWVQCWFDSSKANQMFKPMFGCCIDEWFVTQPQKYRKFSAVKLFRWTWTWTLCKLKVFSLIFLRVSWCVHFTYFTALWFKYKYILMTWYLLLSFRTSWWDQLDTHLVICLHYLVSWKHQLDFILEN